MRISYSLFLFTPPGIFRMRRMICCIITHWSSQCTGNYPTPNQFRVPEALIMLLIQDGTTEKNKLKGSPFEPSTSLGLCVLYIHFVFLFRHLGYQENICSRHSQTRGYLHYKEMVWVSEERTDGHLWKEISHYLSSEIHLC